MGISSSPYMVKPEDGIVTKEQNDNEECGNLHGIVQREKGCDFLESVHYMEFDFTPMIAADVQNLGYSRILLLAFRINGLIDSNGGFATEEKISCSFRLQALLVALCQTVPQYGSLFLFFEIVVGFPLVPLAVIGILLALTEVYIFYGFHIAMRSAVTSGFFRQKCVIQHIEKSKISALLGALVPFCVLYLSAAIFIGYPQLSSPYIYRKVLAYLSVFFWPLILAGTWHFAILGKVNIANTLLGQFSKQFSDDCVKLLLVEDKDRDLALKELQKRQEKIMRIMGSYNESSSGLLILNLFDLNLWFALAVAGMCYPQPDGSLSWIQILIGFLLCLACIMFFQYASDIRAPSFHFNNIEKRLNGAYHLNRVLKKFHGSHANFKAWLNGSKICISAFGIHLDEELFSRIGAVLSTVLVAGLGVVARTVLL